MNVFVHFSGQHTAGLDEIEDALDDALGGVGQVTGSGSGGSGGNIDIELTNPSVSPEKAASVVRKVLNRFGSAKSARIDIQGT